MEDFYGLIKDADDQATREWLRDDRNMLYAELFIAERQARKGGKGKTYDTHAFEALLFDNLLNLTDDLLYYTYRPSRGTAHVIFNPVQREIFAAPYRDRVVHHYVVNAIIDWWEKRLCYESCSCRIGKGTSFGIERLEHHIRSVSHEFTRPYYVIKMDISGYFMHINRKILFDRVVWGLDQQFRDHKDRRYLILRHAIEAIVFDDPVKGCKIQGSYEDWRGLPKDKSLFYQPAGWGLVIGNLTSQFFSNIYLDPLDRFITQKLGYRHYGRYVDDFYIVVTKDQLVQAKRDIGAISCFLNSLDLNLNRRKTQVFLPGQGVPFLGAVVKNHTRLPNKRITKNFACSARALVSGTGSIESIASYLGLLIHYNGKKVTKKIFDQVGWDYNW